MAAEIQAASCLSGVWPERTVRKNCWYHAIKGSEKGQRKGTRTKDDDDKRKGVCNKCDGCGDSGDPHCLTYTDDQFHWITTMGKLDLWWNSRTSLSFCWTLVLHVGCGRAG